MNRMLYVLLLVVALAAAVLSFDALHGLAVLCGFTPNLAPLLPITVDAGAAAGSFVWLRGEAPAQARRFARVLALVLLGGSVAGNALGHGLSAYAAHPAWWVVVIVSAVPPAVLGAVVHLAVLAGRSDEDDRHQAPAVDLNQAEPGADRAVSDQPPPSSKEELDAVVVEPKRALPGPTRAAELVAAGLGRVQLQRELGVSEHAAKQLIKAHRNGHRYGGETS